MSSKNKKRRVETKLPAEFFVPDLTVPQLRGALQQHGIDHKPLKLKQELVDKLQQALAEEKILQREQRIQSLDNSSGSSSSASSSASSAASASKVATPANKSGFHRLSSDTIVDVTDCLEFPEIGALARSCKLLNTLASLKLHGPPSLALARRAVFDTRDAEFVAKLKPKTLASLIDRLQHVVSIDVDQPQSAALEWFDRLIKASAGTLVDVFVNPASDRRDEHFLHVGPCISAESMNFLLLHCPCLEEVSLLFDARKVPALDWPPASEDLHVLCAPQLQLTAEQLRLLLRTSEHLEELEVSTLSLSDEVFPAQGLPSLTSLTLHCEDAKVNFELDWLARLPSLERLGVEGKGVQAAKCNKPLCHESLRNLSLILAVAVDLSLLSFPQLEKLCVAPTVQSMRELERIAPQVTFFASVVTVPKLLELVAEAKRPADASQPQLWANLQHLRLITPDLRMAALLVQFESERAQLQVELNQRKLRDCLAPLTNSASAEEINAMYERAKDPQQAKKLAFGHDLLPLHTLLVGMLPHFPFNGNLTDSSAQ